MQAILKYRLIFFVAIFLMILSCNQKKKLLENQKILLPETSVKINISNLNDSIFIQAHNTIDYEVYFYSTDSIFNQKLINKGYSQLNGLEKKLMKFSKKEYANLKYTYLNYAKSTNGNYTFNLPLKKGKQVEILQANNGNFTHYKLHNKYALDFKLNIGDTIFAAADGIVFAVREKSNKGGNSTSFLDWDNYIFVYHPNLNLISSYVHLKFEGALVKPGKSIKANDPIGIVGLTGYTTEPHLHFHVVQLNSNYLYESIPILFKSGYESIKLKKGDIVIKQ